MVSRVTSINGRGITASDGPIGTVVDLLFDEAGWRIRWLLVKTDAWLCGRRILLPAAVLGLNTPNRYSVPLTLTRRQVKDSPETQIALPLSRKAEMNMLDYYGLPPYWSTGFSAGGIAFLNGTAEPPPYRGSRRREEDLASATRTPDDSYLRKTSEVFGYLVNADDGEIGAVEDFVLHESDASIRFLIVDATQRWPGRKILIAPRSTRQINWDDRTIKINVDCQQVKDSPHYGPSTIIDKAFEENFLRYYDRAFATNRRRAKLFSVPPSHNPISLVDTDALTLGFQYYA